MMQFKSLAGSNRMYKIVVMRRGFALLVLNMIIPAIIVCLLSFDAKALSFAELEFTEKEIYSDWLENEKTDAEYDDIGKIINWAGLLFTQKETTFSDDEKKALIDYIHKGSSGFGFSPNAVVYKEDLDGDGRKEYIATLTIKPALPFHYGQVIALLIPKEKGFTIRVVSSPLHMWLGLTVSIKFADIDGDGLKEIVEQRVQQEDPENPTYNIYDTVIYKNNGTTFLEIYRRRNYDHLHFRDLNGDGRIEILETRNDTPVKTSEKDRIAMDHVDQKWQWINIYEWDGIKLQMVNEKHLPFYIEKQKVYRELLEKTKKEIESGKKRGGEDDIR